MVASRGEKMRCGFALLRMVGAEHARKPIGEPGGIEERQRERALLVGHAGEFKTGGRERLQTLEHARINAASLEKTRRIPLTEQSDRFCQLVRRCRAAGALGQRASDQAFDTTADELLDPRLR